MGGLTYCQRGAGKRAGPLAALSAWLSVAGLSREFTLTTRSARPGASMH